ncbi:hypothetical protein BJX96DRAFT_53998 [Aspergillus floccosus]
MPEENIAYLRWISHSFYHFSATFFSGPLSLVRYLMSESRGRFRPSDILTVELVGQANFVVLRFFFPSLSWAFRFFSVRGSYIRRDTSLHFFFTFLLFGFCGRWSWRARRRGTRLSPVLGMHE